MKAASEVSRKRLKYVASINDEALGDDVAPDYELEYIDIGSVDSSGIIHEVATHSFADAPSRARRRVRDGDVIISCVRTYLQAIAPIRNPPDNLIVSTGFAVVRPQAGVFDPGFAKYALREPSFLAEVERRSVGVSYPAINASDLADIPVRLPAPPSQRTIADYLDRETARLDALVGAKERVLGLLAEKRRVLITQAVTRGLDSKASLRESGIPWLGKIPAHWQVVRLRFIVHRIEQGWSPQAENREPAEEEWGVLKVNAVNKGQFDDSAAKALPLGVKPQTSLEVRAGDFLVTRSNTPALVGDACFIEATRPRLMLCDLIYRLALRIEQVDGRFLAHFLSLPIGRNQVESDARGTSASMVKVSHEHIKDWVTPLPPADEQKAIVKQLAKELTPINRVVTATERTIALLKERRAALIAAVVTGQIDVEAAA